MFYFIFLITSFLVLVLANNTVAFDHQKQVATGESYFDFATGHRYIKNSDATYREYTKKGELFRVTTRNPEGAALGKKSKLLTGLGHKNRKRMRL